MPDGPTYNNSTAINQDYTFKVDAIITWVDGSDPDWQKQRSKYIESENQEESRFRRKDGDSSIRFIDIGEIEFCIKGILEYLPWIRNIYLVTMRPQNFNFDFKTEKLFTVHHDDFFEEKEFLPSFNSHAIESQLHRIPGLAEHFVYFNDDTFIGKPLEKSFFFTGNGRPKLYIRNFYNLTIQAAMAYLNHYGVSFTTAGSNLHQCLPCTKTAMYEAHKVLRDPLRYTASSRFRSRLDVYIFGLIFLLGRDDLAEYSKLADNEQLYILAVDEIAGITREKEVLDIIDWYEKNNPSLICISGLDAQNPVHQEAFNKFSKIYSQRLIENKNTKS